MTEQQIFTIAMTGTSKGHLLTEHQCLQFKEHLQTLWTQGFTHFRHGDCVGADAMGHQLAVEIGFDVVVHPPDNDRLRAFCQSRSIMPVQSYRERNQAMVNRCDLLLALPNQNQEVNRSGTWMTVRMARRANVPIMIFYPDGRVIKENQNLLF